MKKILLSLSVSCLLMTVTAQIATTTVAPARTAAVPYDSTLNWLGSDQVAAYEGQTLYVTPKEEAEQKYGYDFFYTHGETPKEMLASYYSTPHERLAGKSFVVERVERISPRYYAFALKQVDDTLRLGFRYDTDEEDSFPFQTMAHYDYLRGYVGKSYYVKPGYLHKTDVVSGLEITFDYKDVWTVADVRVIEGQLALLMKRGSVTSYVHYQKMADPRLAHYYIPQSLYDQWLAKYGEKVADYTIGHKLGKGMTAEMLRYSWGQPAQVVEEGSDEVYVYGAKRIRVDKVSGLVTSWE